MENKNRFAFVYLILAVALLLGWSYIQNWLWPPPPKPQKAKPDELVGMVAGTPATAALDPEVDVFGKIAAERKQQYPEVLGSLGGSPVTVAIAVDAPALAADERRKKSIKPATPSELIAMGHASKPFHLRVRLNTHGGAIQQVILSDHQEADREGLPVKNKDGSAKPLHLLPGVRFPRTEKIRDQREVEVPELSDGKIEFPPEKLEHPSYVMYHYERDSDWAPVDTLGNREWRVVRNETAADADTHVVEFETELGAPFYIRIKKTFTLNRNEYHIGLTVSIVPHDRPADAKAEPFRYQIDGPRGMPIEGEWYTPTYRQGVVGWQNTRALEDPRTVWNMSGSDKHPSSDKEPIRYVAIMVQYFASALAIDNVQTDGQSRDILDYVRFTPHGEPVKVGTKKKEHPFLNDITFRAVTKPVNVTSPVTHNYVLYQGPVKVRLLKQLQGDQAVPEETVDRYRDSDKLNLSTLTDAPMPNWLGKFANFIFWTDIVIFFTNLIHTLLYWLSHVVSNLGICIILITVMVRGIMHPFSRRQMINAKKMQAKQEKLAPEIKKLTEKYGDDFQKLNAEKMKLYREHGINPAAAMGGCILLLCQMPIFMGLYYALQESIFFRLEPVFGSAWIPNLAAPDMLLWWSESIPFISEPEDLGGMIYLGPYFNLLPVIAVALMMYSQSKMLPKSEDPQIQMQQKTMKIMMILMLFFFYKSAAGLAIYFICSSLWGMIERKLLPKKVTVPDEPAAPVSGPPPRDREKPKPVEPKGWLGKKMAGWREKWQKILEEAQKQQQIQRERGGQQPGPGQQPPGPRGPGGKKKKRR